MTKINISDILKQSLIGVNNVKSIEVESHDPIEVVESHQPITKVSKAITANKNTTKAPTSRRVNKGVKVSQNSWNKQISELELFFNSIDLPKDDIRLSPCEVITDIHKFINSHFGYVKRYNGNMTFEPYLMRLEKLKDKLKHSYLK